MSKTRAQAVHSIRSKGKEIAPGETFTADDVGGEEELVWLVENDAAVLPAGTSPNNILPQLDHDGDGAPGGSKPHDDDKEAKKALRAEFKRRTGENAPNVWSLDVLRAKVAELPPEKSEQQDDGNAELGGEDTGAQDEGEAEAEAGSEQAESGAEDGGDAVEDEAPAS